MTSTPETTRGAGAPTTPAGNDEALLAAIVDSSDDAIISKDLNGVITSWNRSAERIFGYTAAEAIGQHITLIIPEDRRDEETRIITRIRAGQRVHHFDTLRLRKDGSLVAISLAVSPVRATDGTVIGASNISRDITERRRFEEAQRQLSRELNHRSKNLLAIVQSIIRHTAARSTPETFLERIGERLQGLSANQDLLVDNNWRGAEISQIVQVQLAHISGLDIAHVSFAGEPLDLAPTAAQTLGIALHELATNAVRHGCLSIDTGRVTIAWRLEQSSEQPELVITWREEGGPQVTPPDYAGFGTAVIRRITGQSMGGRVATEFEPTGLRWELRAPADGLMAPPLPLAPEAVEVGGKTKGHASA